MFMAAIQVYFIISFLNSRTKKKTTDLLILKIGIDKNENGHFFIRLSYDLTDN